MTRVPGEQIDNLRERIKASGKISDADREALLEFDQELAIRRGNIGEWRHAKLLRHCVILAEKVGGIADALDDRDTARDIVTWINSERAESEETNRDYRVAFRRFGVFLAGTDGDPPESLEWISTQTPSNYDPSPDPTEMLDWDEHIVPMIDATENNRDAAIIAVAWDAGARSGEFRSLEYGDVTDHEFGLQISVDGKTGQRSVTLIPSVPYLQRWRSDHPTQDASDPLWSHLHSGDELSYRMFKKVLESAAEKAGVDRPVTLTNFRKSCASYLASRNLNQAHLEDRQGWVRGSDVASRYVALFGGDTDLEVARIHGLDVEPKAEDGHAPVVCPRCKERTPRERRACVFCGQALDHEAAQVSEDIESDLADDMVDADTPEEAGIARGVYQRVSEDPEFRADLLERYADRHSSSST